MENRSSKASRSSGRSHGQIERTHVGFILSKLQLFKRHKKSKLDTRHDEGFFILLSKLQPFEPHKSAKQ
ncbi:hypothetical protein ZIOFF_070661 [Zingiber officinale]|uniref:Uncharacterized protein n=1 Tax=Zingiber officinale TaxID=94328 RepID=A0A8J5CU78_ZINOF|nr:hypothetical protein ZIOFF_070661 [Zingiber officinale]